MLPRPAVTEPVRVRTRTYASAPALLLALCAVIGCGGGAREPQSGESKGTTPAAAEEPSGGATALTLGAYTTPREAYGKAILPAFRKHWQDKTGKTVEFRESYLASGAQARAIISGFEADVAALSLEPDLEKIREAGLIKHDYKAGEGRGMVSQSVVVIGVRKGNPKNIEGWDDLAKPGIEVLTPDVRTSGGAMWNVAAIYGAALRGHTKAKAGDKEAATQLLGAVLANVKILDKGARESLLNFERGVGDAIITYENEILVGRMKNQDYDYVIPKSTISIENPVSVVDTYADRHGSRELADAFVAFLGTPESQRAFAEYGLRPVLPAVASEIGARFPKVNDLFTVRDLGGWKEVQRTLFD